MACYRRMELDSLVASNREDYVRMALMQGQDRELREHTRQLIVERREVLFRDATAVSEYERLFVELIEQNS